MSSSKDSQCQGIAVQNGGSGMGLQVLGKNGGGVASREGGRLAGDTRQGRATSYDETGAGGVAQLQRSAAP
jgi:hypothetical protein